MQHAFIAFKTQGRVTDLRHLIDQIPADGLTDRHIDGILRHDDIPQLFPLDPLMHERTQHIPVRQGLKAGTIGRLQQKDGEAPLRTRIGQERIAAAFGSGLPAIKGIRLSSAAQTLCDHPFSLRQKRGEDHPVLPFAHLDLIAQPRRQFPRPFKMFQMFRFSHRRHRR